MKMTIPQLKETIRAHNITSTHKRKIDIQKEVFNHFKFPITNFSDTSSPRKKIKIDNK